MISVSCHIDILTCKENLPTWSQNKTTDLAAKSAALTLDGYPMQQVEKFLYLYSVVSMDCGAVKDVETRVRKGRGAFKTLDRTMLFVDDNALVIVMT